jgi:hypothetical protein
MMKLWLKRILQIVGALALVALVAIVYRRTDWSKGFTPDGVMTLAAGVIAFVAVIIQIRSSSKQVQDQIKAHRDAEQEERERQKRAVASAILFEIDSSYRYLLRDVREFLRTVDPEKEELRTLGIKPLVARFPVLDANAVRIGDLGEHAAADVVWFYSGIRAYLASLDAFALSHEQWLGKPDDALLEHKTRAYLSHAKNTIPSLIYLAHEVSRELCRISSRPFKSPSIAVAAEDMNALREEITKMGDGAIFEPEIDAQTH